MSPLKIGSRDLKAVKIGSRDIIRIMHGTREIWAAGGGGGFTPASLDGLQLWLDADDATTITEASGAVSAWADKSSSGLLFTQGTAGLQPTLAAAAHAGRAALRFDGADDYLDGGSAALLRNAPGATLYAVAQPHGSQGTNPRQVVFVKVPGVNEARISIERSTGTTGQHRSFYRKLDGDSNSFFSSGTTWSVNALACVGTLLDWDAESRTMRVDGVQLSQDTGLGTSGAFSDTDADRVYIARHARSTTSRRWHGDICEVVAYGRALEPEEVAELEAYLMTKWGLS